MQLSITRDALLKPLQHIGSVVERRQTLPILSHILIHVEPTRLTLTGTDLEIEATAYVPLTGAEAGVTTLPARKMLDICRTLPDGSEISLNKDGDRTLVTSGKSRFVLNSLPAKDFPSVDDIKPQVTFVVEQGRLKEHIEQTQFAMAQQDVRYYLNGMLLELDGKQLKTVATDGHRLAICTTEGHKIEKNQQVIVPRKGVIELARLLEDSDTPIQVEIGQNHIRLVTDQICFISKLIDGRFPDYQRVLPAKITSRLNADRQLLSQALTRASILSNEKYRGVRFQVDENTLTIGANNPDQEEATEELDVVYQGDAMEIGFNATYVLDALSAVKGEQVEIGLIDPNSCCVIRGLGDEKSRYVVMPMRL
jgi:DNA polymerase-3 subunit beta